MITTVNKEKVNNIEEMAQKINNSSKDSVSVGYLRDGKKNT
ncbi:MAG: hypothetical protein V8Q71_02390 [Bacilli bacterium]